MDTASYPLSEFVSLLRLLDDETPAVRTSVAARLAAYGGDVSDHMVAARVKLSPSSLSLLCEMLRPARREELRRDWIVPTDGPRALDEDWEYFESLLRLVSDFLHDGVSLRQPMSDALDLLVEEAEEAGATTDPDALRTVLFANGRFHGNTDEFHSPSNSDLAWVLEEGTSNPLGLALIYILTARRLSLEVEGCNNPGHFLARIRKDDQWFIVDCFNQGRIHALDDILSGEAGTHPAVRAVFTRAATPGEMLSRLLHNLEESFKRLDRCEDAALMRELAATLDA
jgi:hypothetical protein